VFFRPQIFLSPIFLKLSGYVLTYITTHFLLKPFLYDSYFLHKQPGAGSGAGQKQTLSEWAEIRHRQCLL